VYIRHPLKIIAAAHQEGIPVTVENLFFCLRIADTHTHETYHHLSLDRADERYLRTMLKTSALCTVSVATSAGVPEPLYERYAAGGSDGIAELSAQDFIGYYHGLGQYQGIGCFESLDTIALIAVPDMFWLLSLPGKPLDAQRAEVLAIQHALVMQAERSAGRFAILDMPPDLSLPEMERWIAQIASANASVYYPFIIIRDPQGPQGAASLKMPPSGAVCGCISTVDTTKGIFHAPANILISGAVGLAAGGDGQYPPEVNVLRYFPGRGVKLWGARTTARSEQWRYINVRRTFLRIAQSLKGGTQWVVFEPNTTQLHKRLIRQVSGFLLDLWRQGYLAGATAEQGFYVRCDDELNPPEDMDRGIVRFEAGLALARPVEFVTIVIQAEKEDAGVDMQEADHG
jgi:phage tail sheath protein FI